MRGEAVVDPTSSLTTMYTYSCLLGTLDLYEKTGFKSQNPEQYSSPPPTRLMQACCMCVSHARGGPADHEMLDTKHGLQSTSSPDVGYPSHPGGGHPFSNPSLSKDKRQPLEDELRLSGREGEGGETPFAGVLSGMLSCRCGVGMPTRDTGLGGGGGAVQNVPKDRTRARFFLRAHCQYPPASISRRWPTRKSPHPSHRHVTNRWFARKTGGTLRIFV